MSTKKSSHDELGEGIAPSQLELFHEVAEKKSVSEVVFLDAVRIERSSRSLADNDESRFIARRLIDRVSLF